MWVPEWRLPPTLGSDVEQSWKSEGMVRSSPRASVPEGQGYHEEEFGSAVLGALIAFVDVGKIGVVVVVAEVIVVVVIVVAGVVVAVVMVGVMVVIVIVDVVVVVIVDVVAVVPVVDVYVVVVVVGVAAFGVAAAFVDSVAKLIENVEDAVAGFECECNTVS